jgi:hypothetical protein
MRCLPHLMEPHMTRTALLIAALACAADAFAQHPMRPGRWEVTMQMEMPGMPMQMPPTKTSQCITAEQLKEPNSALPSGAANPNACKITDHKVAANIVTWKVACSGAEAMSGSGEMKFDGDAYTGVMKMSADRGLPVNGDARRRAGRTGVLAG